MINTVIDLSHHNGNVDLVQAKADGISGIIHKATQGTTYTDPMYANNCIKATNAGLYWGAYHFGTGEDGVEQADYFLSIVNPRDQDLLILDFENNPTGPTMTLDQACAFVTRIQEKTGRWPGLYSGSLIKQLLGTQKNATLANCWFWLAQYGDTPTIPSNWPYWTMWQYTDGNAGPLPHSVNGVGNCDRDQFNGDMSGLQRLWNIVPAV
jgi:lysozyme